MNYEWYIVSGLGLLLLVYLFKTFKKSIEPSILTPKILTEQDGLVQSLGVKLKGASFQTVPVKIQIIKIVKKFTGLGLKECKDIVDKDGIIPKMTDQREIERLKNEVEKLGAGIEFFN